MGHRLSKSNSATPNTSTTITATNHRHSNESLRLRNEENLNANPAGPPLHPSTASIDVRTSVLTSLTPATNQNLHIESATVTVPAQAAARRFVIKIQLTKMEAGSSLDDAASTTLSTSVALNEDNGNTSTNLDNNLNVTRPILNLTFTKNIQCDSSDQIVIESNEEIKLNNLSGALSDRRVGGCMMNSSFISNFSPIKLVDEDENDLHNNNNSLSLRERKQSMGIPCTNGASIHWGQGMLDVPETDNSQQKIKSCNTTGSPSIVCACAIEGQREHCCRRKKSTAYPSKWRCCKCMCRTSTGKDCTQADDVASSVSSASSTSSQSSSKASWTSKLNCTRAENPAVDSADLAMWMPPENAAFLSLTPSSRHLVPLTDVLLLTLNCPPSLVVGPIEDCDERARRLRALEIETGFDPMSELGLAFANALSGQKRCDHVLCSLCSPTFRHVVHSQVDYIHCLVPDLDKITNSSFYWGKMDRYEAERLLEGKPEGTFLLRDSAQEEYLFSVTFRKYGRSLHARIEQFNHKFSFDCHDPGVFTARTVTGLLEHYKDPSCVMFFEPMLTIPLHRNFTFSLQQLCRATIVSHVTYDGINELHLPNSLKSYLKEYHYKLRVRVKPFDDFYHCS